MLFAGIECVDNIFLVSLMDENKTVKAIFKFYKEGLLWFIDHYSPNIIAVSYDFPVRSKIALINKAYSNLYKLIIEQFEYTEVDRRSFKEKEKRILKSDPEEFWKKIIRKEILPSETPEGLEQRLYNLPKTGIRLNKRLLSQNKKLIAKEIDAVILSFAGYSFYNNIFENEETENDIIIIPKYIYVMKKGRQETVSSEGES